MIKKDKQYLRNEIKQKAKTLNSEYKRKSDEEITKLLLSSCYYLSAKCIFCFIGTKDEIDTSYFIRQALKDGKRIGVPLCTGRGVMEAREITSLNQLEIGSYGILEPQNSCPLISPAEFDFAVIPCVSCDRKGNRLGHGGGYYDRYLEKKTYPCAVICWEKLLSDEVPTEKHDLKLDALITESKIYDTRT